MDLIGDLQKKNLKATVPTFDVGDTVDVEVRIKEGEKERIQVFTGVVIAKKGGGVNATFTVRRIVQGEGVERVFPVHSPKVAEIRVKRRGRVRRAKLYYLRGRTGKAARIPERLPAAGSKAKKGKGKASS
ncbi:MAG: 50S ribosomal protein L19 [Planctomycetota bacterium JB042]